jgi:putative sporulation protein YtaF
VVWIAAVTIAVVSNLDNLTVGIALGIRPLRVDAIANLIVATVTMIGTAVAMTLGHALSDHLPAPTTHLLGRLTLIAIGAWMTATGAHALRRPTANASPQAKGDPLTLLHEPLRATEGNHSGTLSDREALVLGAALAINNFASGVPAGAARIPPILVTGLAGTFSLVCVGGGARLASAFARQVAHRYAGALAGVMMLAAGALAATGS